MRPYIFTEFEIQLTLEKCEYDELTTYQEPYDGEWPDDPGETGFLEDNGALRAVYTVYGHIEPQTIDGIHEGGVVALYEDEDLENAERVCEGLNNLLGK